jgi:tetratricopeptide (TPR) repeat protein
MESLLLFGSGILWSLYLSSHPWSKRDRAILTGGFTLGMALLSVLAFVRHSRSIHPPFWPTDVFGFFPNRNQSANVLSIAAILSFGLALRALPSSEDAPASQKNWAWLVLLPAFLASLISINSRAGIVLLFLGLVAVGICHCFFSRIRRTLALAASAGLLLLTAFFLFGGKLLQRLQSKTQFSEDLRAALQIDALSFSMHHPFLGCGAGNFAALFGPLRRLSAGQNMAIHPESDWLWAVGELGWPVGLLLLASAGWWLRSSFPFPPNSDRRLRVTLAVTCTAFLLHSALDVPGHRLGSVVPALLLITLAANPDASRAPSSPFIWRMGGLGLVVLGALVSAESLSASQRSATPSADCLPWALPSQRLARIQKCIDAASEQEDFEEIAALSSKALEISPLNWRFHFLRAAASVQFPIPDVETARAGFTAARRLHPNLVSICLEEGRLWQAAGQPEESIVALREALRRTPRSTMPIEGVFASCLNAVGPRIDQRLRLRPLADSDRSLLMPYLHSASGSEWEKETRVLLEKDPDFESFSSTQRKMLFEWWCFHPNREQLFIHLQNRPRLHADGWRCLALHMAEKGSFKEACELALRHSNRPSLPDLPTSEPLPELERRFARQPADPIAGLTLLFAQKRAGLHRDALRTLGQLRTRPNPPPYLPFLQFQLHSALEEWEAAWRSWKG